MAISRKKKKFPTLVALSGFLILSLVAFIGYYRLDSLPVDAREVVNQGIQLARTTKNISVEQENALRIQIAISDYIARNTRPPSTLFDLVPTYFDRIPEHPKTKKPFYYERKGMSYILRASKETTVRVATVDKFEDDISASSLALSSSTQGGEEEFVNPNMMEKEDFVYDPTKMRDPFVAFDFSPKVVHGEGVTPLERYSLEQLRLTAVISGPDGNLSAIVEDASGRGYTVTSETKIGSNGGVVISVESDHLKVLETQVDFTGKETQKVEEMKISTRPGAEEDTRGKRGRGKKRRR